MVGGDFKKAGFVVTSQAWLPCQNCDSLFLPLIVSLSSEVNGNKHWKGSYCMMGPILHGVS